MKRICISEATTLPSTFAEDLSACAEAGWPGMEVWLTKLENHLQKHSPADTRKLIEDSGLRLAAAAYQGGLLLSQGEQRLAHYDHFRRRLELCRRFGIPTLIVAADFAEPVAAAEVQRAVVSLSQAAQWAAGFDVRLALEFRARSTFCASLDTALNLIHLCGEPNVGICFDVFHYYTGPSKLEDVRLLGPERLAHVQLSDLAGIPRELAADSDRVLPGDGDFQLQPLVEVFRALGYAGWISLELMNPTLWAMPVSQVAAIALAALRRVVGGDVAASDVD